MNYNDIFAQTLKVLTTRTESSKAQHPALYSDIIAWRFPQTVFESAYLALNASILLPFIGLNSDSQSYLRNQLSKVAHSRNLEGYWNLVERLVRLEPYTPFKVLCEALDELGPNAYFGNHLKSMKRIYDNMKCFNPYEADSRPVKEPQRKRGYNDKGHLPTAYHGISGKPTKSEKQEYQIISEGSRFYSNSSVGDRSYIAAELVKKPTVRKRSQRRKSKTVLKEKTKSLRPLGPKVTKEEWKNILNFNGKN